jgi:hypothetical protein
MTNALHSYKRDTKINCHILKYLNENKLHAMKRKRGQKQKAESQVCMGSEIRCFLCLCSPCYIWWKWDIIEKNYLYLIDK